MIMIIRVCIMHMDMITGMGHTVMARAIMGIAMRITAMITVMGQKLIHMGTITGMGHTVMGRGIMGMIMARMITVVMLVMIMQPTLDMITGTIPGVTMEIIFTHQPVPFQLS